MGDAPDKDALETFPDPARVAFRSFIISALADVVPRLFADNGSKESAKKVSNATQVLWENADSLLAETDALWASVDELWNFADRSIQNAAAFQCFIQNVAKQWHSTLLGEDEHAAAQLLNEQIDLIYTASTQPIPPAEPVLLLLAFEAETSRRRPARPLYSGGSIEIASR